MTGKLISLEWFEGTMRSVTSDMVGIIKKAKTVEQMYAKIENAFKVDENNFSSFWTNALTEIT